MSIGTKAGTAAGIIAGKDQNNGRLFIRLHTITIL
jgi:hypothetical protein